MNDRRLLKFKHNERTGDVFVKYERGNPASTLRDEFTLKCGEAPRLELKAALQKMAKHAIEICELPDDFLLHVISVSISYSDENVQGLVITTMRSLKNSNAPMLINTPNFSREPYSETGDPDVSIFSHKCAEDLDALEGRVFLYVEGERAQRKLDFEAQPEEEPVIV